MLLLGCWPMGTGSTLATGAPVELPSGPARNHCEKSRWLLLRPAHRQGSDSDNAGNWTYTTTLDAYGYAVFPLVRPSRGKTYPGRSSNSAVPADAIPLRKLWPHMAEPELEQRHEARIIPTEEATNQWTYWRIAAWGSVGVGLTAALIHEGDQDNDVALWTAVGAGVFAAVAGIVSMTKQPSRAERLRAKARMSLFYESEDDMNAVRRGVDRVNVLSRRACQATPNASGTPPWTRSTPSPGNKAEAPAPRSKEQRDAAAPAQLESPAANQAAQHYRKGVRLHRLGDSSGAQKEFEAAIAADPSHALAHLNLGALLHHAGQLEEAEREYRQAIRLAPRDALARVDLALLLAERGQRSPAEEVYLQALKIDPEHGLANIGLGVLRFDAGRYDEAVGSLRNASKHDELRGRAEAYLGRVHYWQGDWESAVRAYSVATDQLPTDSALLIESGRALQAAGRYADAVATFERARDLLEQGKSTVTVPPLKVDWYDAQPVEDLLEKARRARDE